MFNCNNLIIFILILMSLVLSSCGKTFRINKIKFYDSEGTLNRYLVMAYDENGNVIKKTLYDSNDTQLSDLVITVENNNVVSEFYSDSYNSSTLQYAYEYDVNGNRTNKKIYLGNEKSEWLSTEWIWAYDSNNITSLTYKNYYLESTTIDYYLYEYNADGKLNTISCYYNYVDGSNAEPVSIIVFTYQGNYVDYFTIYNGSTISEDNISFKRNYTYDDSNNLIKVEDHLDAGIDGVWLNDDDYTRKYLVYENDSNGNKIKEIRSDDDYRVFEYQEGSGKFQSDYFFNIIYADDID